MNRLSLLKVALMLVLLWNSCLAYGQTLGSVPQIIGSTVRAERETIFLLLKSQRPEMDTRLLKQYARLFVKYVPKELRRASVAIAVQESGLRANVLRADETGITDVGLFQIHTATAAYYGIDVPRLQRDIEYQFASHARILKDKVSQCEHLQDKAWVCYHSFTPSKQQFYRKAVERWM